MKYVIDTSSLISLARIQYLEIISALRIKGLLPHEVYAVAELYILEGEKYVKSERTC